MATGSENFYEDWAQECTSQWELNRKVLETIKKRKAELKSAQEDYGSISFCCFLRRFFCFIYLTPWTGLRCYRMFCTGDGPTC